MVYKSGRFVIHYKDGTTYIEDRNDNHSWDKRPRKPIKAIGIQPDSTISINQVTTDPKTGKEIKKQVNVNLGSHDPNVKFILNEIVLKGSFKFNYGFFMDRLTDQKIMRISKKGKWSPVSEKNTWGIRIGVVVDNQGHCFCLEYVGTGSPRGYYTTVHSLGMDQNSLVNNYDIHLEELPDPHENFAPFPEINPLVLEERKKREEKKTPEYQE